MENIKCLEKILAKEDEKHKERNYISKKKYRDDDSDSYDDRRKRRKYSRSRSRSKDSYDKKCIKLKFIKNNFYFLKFFI